MIILVKVLAINVFIKKVSEEKEKLFASHIMVAKRVGC
jgi:hypothetical protein